MKKKHLHLSLPELRLELLIEHNKHGTAINIYLEQPKFIQYEDAHGVQRKYTPDYKVKRGEQQP